MNILRRRIMVLGCGGEDFVDLDLPSGMLWAKGNIVSDGRGGYRVGEETDYGAFVSWGNIEPHFTGDGYLFNNANYNASSGNSVTGDIPTNDALHDAALALLGGNCHLPSKDDFSELSLYTDNEYTTINNVNGWKFMKKTDHSVYVFFPYAGYGGDSSYSGPGTQAYYWSSGWYSAVQAYRFKVVRGTLTANEYSTRRFGHSVRAVCKPMFPITITLEGEDVEGITVTVKDSDGILHSGTTNFNGVVRLTGIVSGSAKVFAKDYYITNGHITVNASSRMFTCGLEQRESKYLTFYSITDCTHKFTKAVSYSLNGGTTWQSLAANTNLTVTAGNSVMWKATLPSGSGSGIGRFSITSDTMRFDVEGNPMSLLYGDNFIGKTDLTRNIWAFYSLFNGNKGVVDAQNMALPATTLGDSCYNGMFLHCTSLTSAPELPATILAFGCYNQMFVGCTSLTTAPELPATTLERSCYYQMFMGCTSLTTAPELLATTLVQSCYSGMFLNCSSLNYIKCMATDISASYCLYRWVEKVAASGVFHKDIKVGFQEGSDGIPSGWTVVEDFGDYLTFTASEDGTFQFNNIGLSYSTDKANWTALSPNTPTPTVSAGDSIYFKGTMTPASNSGIGTFSSTGNFTVSGNAMSLLYGDNYEGKKSLSGKNYAFYRLFNNCTKLTDASELILPATTLATQCYYYMFLRCTALTTAPALPATTLANGCYYNMFYGCTALTTVPSLLATTLSESCYNSMFYGCTNLTTAPILPAATLADYCYYNMFYNCSSLNYIKCMATDISASYCLYYWVANVPEGGTFVKSESMSSWPTSINGIPSGWTVLDD